MVLFDLTKYELKFEVTKPNDKNEFKFGDKVKCKTELKIKKEFFIKMLTIRFFQSTRKQIGSKVDEFKKDQTETKKLFEEKLIVSNTYEPTEFGPKILLFEREIALPNNNETNKSLTHKLFDAMYPEKSETNFYFEVELKLVWPYDDELIKKDIIVK